MILLGTQQSAKLYSSGYSNGVVLLPLLLPPVAAPSMQHGTAQSLKRKNQPREHLITTHLRGFMGTLAPTTLLAPPDRYVLTC